MEENRKKICFTITEEEDGRRLDQVLAVRWPDFPRTFFQKCISDHMVFADHLKIKPSLKVAAGMKIDFLWPEMEVHELKGEDIPLNILYEDADMLVLNKPAGLVVHPAAGNRTGTLVQALLYYEPEIFTDMIDHSERPGIVHRLDKDTSGVLVVAKNMQSWESLKNIFRDHRLCKVYRAVLCGKVEPEQGRIETMIGRHPVHRLKMAVVTGENGKAALTKYRVLDSCSRASLAEIRIYTGRTHQIRVHAAHLGYPVWGDTLYGKIPKAGEFQCGRQLLHAWKLTLPHPLTGQMMTFQAPLPEEFQAAADFYGLNWPPEKV